MQPSQTPLEVTHEQAANAEEALEYVKARGYEVVTVFSCKVGYVVIVNGSVAQ